MSNRLKTFVYVDGFNLYYRAVKGTPYKWLDIPEMCRRILPRNDIRRTKYFTARVNARPGDPDQPQRQQMFLRALASLPDVEIIYGHFLSNRSSMLRADAPARGESRWVDVIRTEEKGSDVNIATHLIHDAHMKRFEAAVLVTNDSDLCVTVRIVRDEIGLPIGIICPSKHPSRTLMRNATFYKQIREGVLRDCQLPTELRDKSGMIRKPVRW